MLAADNWCVKVDDKVYGPYTSTQIRKFAHEGRLASWSLIAPAGSQSWREARNERTFASFFGVDVKSLGGRSFGKKDLMEEAAGPGDVDVATRPETARSVRTAPAGAKTQQVAGVANFILVFDAVSGAASRVEAVIMGLGPAFRLADNVWAVSCELTAIGVRNAIAPYLLTKESIFVADTTRGRSSWQNYAPETHSKIAAAWVGAK